MIADRAANFGGESGTRVHPLYSFLRMRLVDMDGMGGAEGETRRQNARLSSRVLARKDLMRASLSRVACQPVWKKANFKSEIFIPGVQFKGI